MNQTHTIPACPTHVVRAPKCDAHALCCTASIFDGFEVELLRTIEVPSAWEDQTQRAEVRCTIFGRSVDFIICTNHLTNK